MRIPSVRRAGTATVASVAVLAVLALAGCSDDEEKKAEPPAPRAPAPVELAVDTGSDEPVKIGVLLAVSTAPGQGQDVQAGAQGARVAAYRLGLDGGTRPDLVVEVDDGTDEGAEEAMTKLVEAGVAGVVVASTGDHLADAVEKAAESDVAVLAPYWRPDVDVPDGVWITGPARGAVDLRLQQALDQRGVDKTLLVTADGITVDGVEVTDTDEFDAGDPSATVEAVEKEVKAKRVDSVLVAASAPTQATVVSLLQGALPSLPIVLTPEALSPDFAEQLTEAGGTTSGRLTTVGVDAGDASTLTQSAQADSVAAYFAALRLAAGDTSVTDLLGDQPMADAAAGADTASHDAVVALVRAVAAAGATDPAAVRDVLAGLSLDAGDGLAGPPLDFGADPTLPADDVVVLQSTTQDPGVRPTPAPLYWFAAGTGDSTDDASADG